MTTIPTGHPGYPPPPPRRKKWPWILLGIAGLTVLCCGGIAVFIAQNADDPAATSNTAYTLNQPARDGKFEFVVTKLECGKAELGTSFLAKKAQGQYCLATMTVKNIGDEARTFDASSQKAHGAGGVKYEADGAATISLGDNANSFLTSINPGNSVTGQVAWDIPKDAQILKLELHDSVFSGGVTITVAANQ